MSSGLQPPPLPPPLPPPPAATCATITLRAPGTWQWKRGAPSLGSNTNTWQLGCGAAAAAAAGPEGPAAAGAGAPAAPPLASGAAAASIAVATVAGVAADADAAAAAAAGAAGTCTAAASRPYAASALIDTTPYGSVQCTAAVSRLYTVRHDGDAAARYGVPGTNASCVSGGAAAGPPPAAAPAAGSAAASAPLSASHSVTLAPAATASTLPSRLYDTAPSGSPLYPPVLRHRHEKGEGPGPEAEAASAAGPPAPAVSQNLRHASVEPYGPASELYGMTGGIIVVATAAWLFKCMLMHFCVASSNPDCYLPQKCISMQLKSLTAVATTMIPPAEESHQRIATCLAGLYPATAAIDIAAALTCWGITTDIVALLDEWAARFFEELDYIHEGQNSERFAAQMKEDLPQVVVPRTYFDYTSRRVLTSEWLEGEKLSQSKADD
ncbi:hypothetical protein TSOC_013112, partial [Tetrabaena socialis]